MLKSINIRQVSLTGKRHSRLLLMCAVDSALSFVSLPLAVYLRVGNSFDGPLISIIQTGMPLFVFIAIPSFWWLGFYQRVWRYASILELFMILKASALAIAIFVVLLFLVTRLEGLPRSTPFIQWLVLVMMLGAARIVPRLGAERRGVQGRKSIRGALPPALLVGAGDNASLFLQALNRSAEPPCDPVGVLDIDGLYVGLQIRGVPVLGSYSDLSQVVEKLAARGLRPYHLIITLATAELGGAVTRQLVAEGEALGLLVSRLPPPTELQRADYQRIDLRPIELNDLLGRPQAVLDRAAIDRLVGRRRVLITGAGGTIGGELTRQIAALRPSLLILIEASEYNLYEIDLSLKENWPDIPSISVLCNIRDRERVMQTFAKYQPELVFHAAALKHVPIVELNSGEGVLTNIIGTCNVADASCIHHVIAMVQVSSDKAVNPTGIMGATKRLAELYCQALDLKGRGESTSPRFMTVRFGNVLGSSGSLIPLFERQLRRGGPLTVTHPEIKRYFMTVREAVELVLHASACGLQRCHGLGEIFVLDMGEPIRVMDIAHRMIRLAGLQPERDVKIEITGLRPGEKLYEELFGADELRLPVTIPGMLSAVPNPMSITELREAVDALQQAVACGSESGVIQLLRSILPTYRSQEENISSDISQCQSEVNMAFGEPKAA